MVDFKQPIYYLVLKFMGNRYVLSTGVPLRVAGVNLRIRELTLKASASRDLETDLSTFMLFTSPSAVSSKAIITCPCSLFRSASSGYFRLAIRNIINSGVPPG